MFVLNNLLYQYCQRKQSILNTKYSGCRIISDLIIFLFKGGNLLKGYFNRFTQELPGVTSEYIKKIYV